MPTPGRVRRDQALLLLRPSARTVRWFALVVVVPVGALAVLSGAREDGDPATIALPIASALLCVWLAFLFEDPAAATTSGTPTPLVFRRCLRAAITLPLVVATWWSYTWLGPLSGPTRAMAVSFGAEIVVALAAAATTTRAVGSDRGGLPAAGIVVGTMFVLPMVIAWAFDRPASVDPGFPPLGEPSTYWFTVAAVAAVVFALANRDPAGRKGADRVFRSSRRLSHALPVRGPH